MGADEFSVRFADFSANAFFRRSLLLLDNLGPLLDGDFAAKLVVAVVGISRTGAFIRLNTESLACAERSCFAFLAGAQLSTALNWGAAGLSMGLGTNAGGRETEVGL